MGQLAARGFLQALTHSYDKRLGLVCDESLLAAALHRDFVWSTALRMGLPTGKIACINRNSAITALVFAVVLWLLNKPFA